MAGQSVLRKGPARSRVRDRSLITRRVSHNLAMLKGGGANKVLRLF